jgi:rare lipoprotein A
MPKLAARVLPGFAAALCLAGPARAAQAPAPNTPGWEESGEATWYGGRHHGRRTTSGQVFDMNAMTAAHSTLPMGSKVRVTVQDTGESVVVTVNDRLPMKQYRIIDLSRGAAARVGIIRRGAAMVTVESVPSGTAVEVAEAAAK